LHKIHIQHKITAIIILAALALSGCHIPMITDTPRLTPVDIISVKDFAATFNLAIIRNSPLYVALRGAGKRIIIFDDPGGKVYLNGVSAGASGGIIQIKGVPHISRNLISRIRNRLAADIPIDWAKDLPLYKVIVDPGHGGRDPGATSITGSKEKTVNLAVAKHLALLLKRRGLDVTMTRNNDIYVSLKDRAALANNLEAKLFVSIHSDSHNNDMTRGYTVYVARKSSEQSHELSKSILRSMQSVGLASRGMRKAGFKVLVATKCPAVLIELGYLTNEREARRLNDPQFQKRLAVAIARGICNYLLRI